MKMWMKAIFSVSAAVLTLLSAGLCAAEAGTSAVGDTAGANAIRPTDPLQRPAMQAPQAARGVMLAVASAGERIVAAGERGIVLWSDDAAKTWQQAQVPVSVSLTGLSFASAEQGWAVGHGGVVLHTTDGGRTWARQFDGRAAAQLELAAAKASADAKRIAQAERWVADGPDKPLLAVHFWSAKRGFVIGAYGLIFGTEDGGATWASWQGRVDNPKGLHFNALYVKGTQVFLAGEQGLVLRSQDDARSFQRLDSPYRGSWFAATGQGDTVVLAGLRGNVFWSADAGKSWAAARVPVPVSIAVAFATQDGRLLFANQAGMLFASADHGHSLQPLPKPPGPPLTALAQRADGTLLAASFAGAMRLPAETLAAQR